MTQTVQDPSLSPLDVAFPPYLFQEHLLKKKPTDFTNSQTEVFFSLSNLLCPNVCFRSLAARLAQRQVPPPGFPHGVAPAYDWWVEFDNTL